MATHTFNITGTIPDNTFDPFGSASAAQAAAIAHADGLVVGLFDDRGNYDASGNTFPTTGGSGTAGAVLKGDVWRISVAGTLGGNAVDVGDTIRALVDTPGQTAGNWATFDANVQQATETVRGTVAIATQAEAEDSGTTNDIDAITPKKWWQAFTSAFTAVGAALRNLATPGATSWIRVNTDGTVTARTASQTRSDLALGTASTVDTGTGSANVPTVAQADARYLRITNGFVLVKKTSSTSRNNNTLTDDPDLFFPMEANKSYTYTITAFIQASAAGDFKSRVTGPAAPTSVFLSQAGFGTTGMTQSNRIAQAYDSTDLTQVFTSNFVMRLLINGTVNNGVNAGDLVFQWAQNTTAAGNPTLVLAGSTVEWSEI